MAKLKVIVVGAGGRGKDYTDIMARFPEKFQVVGVAEPIMSRREYMRTKHSIPAENCFDTWEKILEKPKLADVAIISTMDRMHFAPAMAAIRKGYHLLLEKPAAPTAEECLAIENEAKKYGVRILVCHVLRYSPFYITLKSLIDKGEIGRVMSIQHAECVGNVHQSHSFVRGNWGNAEKSSPMLLQKSCHDMDILQWLVGKDVKRVSSFGSLTYFTRENAPEGSPEYCIEGCTADCPYNAVKLYYDDKDNDWFRNAATGIVNPTDEEVAHALKTTQYGKCVFKCDNNVVDHQVVNLEFEDGTVVDFNMSAFNKGGRYIRVMGTKGEIVNRDTNGVLELYKFADGSKTLIDIKTYGDTIVSGHGGGDEGIVHALYDYLTTGEITEQLSEIGISVKNHMIAFAAEQSRNTGKTVNIKEYIDSIR
ncbi:MAG: Gfo/Idh/MocA family oxidoreductase [Clostridia bacterium]|nr:Gfo/Idh/MocA family oxidoreductase [Clostridia bacterium]